MQLVQTFKIIGIYIPSSSSIGSRTREPYGTPLQFSFQPLPPSITPAYTRPHSGEQPIFLPVIYLVGFSVHRQNTVSGDLNSSGEPWLLPVPLSSFLLAPATLAGTVIDDQETMGRCFSYFRSHSWLRCFSGGLILTDGMLL